ncbi:TIGR03086 family metal-binding protein [Embleya scabrispora]|uniref:TIGR03086 family metal-binding protein n=1 Tax=Embleya scabrispora TaxID=159449 RepID=UPI000369C1C3|nr:TIGR03086 family metal-binding protein [Embleya scabrispora]MYS84294.1 TIGR03086 family protein [Streptomyces sp. SID5474]
MDQITQYKRAVDAFRPLLAEVDDAKLGLACPCDEWDVRGLLGHATGAQRGLAAALTGPTEPVSEDPREDFEAVVETMLATFTPERIAASIKTPFGDRTGGFLLGLATGDIFVHAWDLARALGKSTDLDPELAETLLERMRTTLPDAARGEGRAFGPQQPVGADASAADRLAAFTGRAVN